jgi:hypothetical protein
MHYLHCHLLLLSLLLMPAAIAAQNTSAKGSPSSAEQQVIAAAERLFSAMRAKDGDALTALLHDHVRLISVRSTGEVTVRSKEEWIRGIVVSAAPLDERMRQPEVRIDGNLATLWAAYTFRRADQVSHCGTNAFQYVQVAGEWRIITVAFTAQTTGCDAQAAPVP